MAFDDAIDNLDLSLLQLGWQAEGKKLVLRGLPKASVQALIKKPGVSERIALLLRRVGLEVAQICCPGKVNGYRVFASMAPEEPANLSRGDTSMKSDSNLTSSLHTPEKFLWFGGIITPELRSHLTRMEESDLPTGLLQPVQGDGIIKTIQWGINSAAVKLFNYNALSPEDMQSVIQRDTSGDWFPEDLEEKRKLYQNAGDRFEQVARIQIKGGWMLVRFQSERIGVGSLVISTGQKESEVVERPELLVAA